MQEDAEMDKKFSLLKKIFLFVTVADLGWDVRVLLSIAGRMSDKPAALEAFGRGVWEGAGQRLGVIPKPVVFFFFPSGTIIQG